MKTAFLALVALLAAAAPARADDWMVSAEGDATRIALGSLSLHLMARPPAWPRLRLGVGRVGGALPGLFHRLFDPNEGWQVSEQGGVLEGFLHHREQGSTWFVGAIARLERWEWRRPELAGSAIGTQVFVMPAVGYRWFPTGQGVFVTPWVGLGLSVWDSGVGRVGDERYQPLRWFPLAAVHVGYER